MKYSLHFEQGENVGGAEKEAVCRQSRPASMHPLDAGSGGVYRHRYSRWSITTDILEASGGGQRRRYLSGCATEMADGSFEETDFYYENGILDYVTELSDGKAMTMPQFWEAERKGRDREDKPEYKVKLSAALCFSNQVNVLEYYHNSSWLEHGGAPEKAVKTAFVYAIDAYIKQTGKYTKNESKITVPGCCRLPGAGDQLLFHPDLL